MDDTSISDSSLIWLWIIEYLASIPQVNSSIIHDLIEIAPVFPDDLAKSTRERVALRCLQDLFGPRIEPEDNTASASTLKNTIDLSKSCEDVLQSILQEVSLHNLILRSNKFLSKSLTEFENGWSHCSAPYNASNVISFLRYQTLASGIKGEGELLKWDVHPFIMHKSASMPKCALEQLRDDVVKSVHPCIPSLKELNVLAHTNVKSNIIPANYGDLNAHLQGNNESVLDGQTMTLIENGIVLSVENENVDGGDYLNSKKLLSFGRDRCCLFDENLGGSYCGTKVVVDGDGIHSNAAKRLRQSFDTMVVNEFQYNDREPTHNADKMPEDTARDAQQQHVIVDEFDDPEPRIPSGERFREKISTSEAIDCSLRTNGQDIPDATSPTGSGFHADINVNDGMELLGEEVMPSCSNLYNHEGVDVAMEKSDIPSSQCTPEATDRMEQNICVKCGKNGRLLVCSSGDCQLLVHEACLGSSATFNDNGEFYCAFCVYATAVIEYLEAKKQASSAKKELCAFFTHGSGLEA